MKKFLLPLPFLALFFLFSSPTRAEECLSHADVPTDQTLKVLSSVNLRSIPCMEGSSIVGGLAGGHSAQVVAVNDGWYKVKVSDTLFGWVWGDFLVDPNMTIPTSTTDPNATPAPNDPGDQECYQHEPVATDQTLKVKEALNLRDGACGEGTQILTVLYPGEIVKAVKVDDGWYNVQRENGTAGWVWASYLTADLKEPLATDPKPVTEVTPVVPDSTPPAFSDIQGTLYQTYIQSLYQAGILKGNPDGTYKPYSSINRAEFNEIVMRALLGAQTPIAEEFNAACFTDIPMNQWYTKATCMSKNKAIVSGYPDGFFRPGQNIELAAAAKIIVNALNVPKKDVQADHAWYEIYIHALDEAQAIPPTLTQPNELVSREEMAAMIYAVMNKKPIPHSTTFNYFPKTTVTPVVQSPSPVAASMDLKQCVANSTLALNIDYYAVAQEVLDSINNDRAARGVSALKLNDALNASSTIWAMEGQFTHLRPNGQTVDQYQQSIGLKPYPVFAENLAQKTLACTGSQCTGKEVIAQAKAAHLLFMQQENNPEGQRNDFDNMMSAEFADFGFGFSIQNGSLLMVYQFSKDVSGDAAKLCETLK